MTPDRLLAVALGGALGAVLRVAVAELAKARLGDGLPYGTLLVNVVGSFAIGMLAALLLRPGVAEPRWAAFLIPGLLGGFTTFSAYSLEVVRLVEQGRPGAAVGYAGVSVLAGVFAAAAGVGIGRLV